MDEHEKTIVTCCICGKAEPIGDAIENGWIPSVWQGDKEIGACCDGCCHSLNLADDGEFEIDVNRN